MCSYQCSYTHLYRYICMYVHALSKIATNYNDPETVAICCKVFQQTNWKLIK